MRAPHRRTAVGIEGAGTAERLTFLAAIISIPPALAITALEPGWAGAAVAGAGCLSAIAALVLQHRRLRRERHR